MTTDPSEASGADTTQGPRPLLSVRQAAHVIGCSVRTVQRLAKEGLLPSIKLEGPNGQYGFAEADCKAYRAQLEARLEREYE